MSLLEDGLMLELNKELSYFVGRKVTVSTGVDIDTGEYIIRYDIEKHDSNETDTELFAFDVLFSTEVVEPVMAIFQKYRGEFAVHLHKLYKDFRTSRD